MTFPQNVVYYMYRKEVIEMDVRDYIELRDLARMIFKMDYRDAVKKGAKKDEIAEIIIQYKHNIDEIDRQAFGRTPVI